MAIENQGMSRRHLGQTEPPLSAAEFALLSGEITAFPQRSAQLPDAQIQAIRQHLDNILRSPHFDGSARSREFLNYVVEEVLAGRGAYLKQAAIAVEVFGRKPDFDAVIDPIVRVQAGRLRRSLERYYLISGDAHAMRIELPKGGYAPVFVEPATTPAPRASGGESNDNWPTVILHPFASQEARHAGMATQLRDEIAAELCRHGIVRVTRLRDAEDGRTGPQPAARFELRGIVVGNFNGSMGDSGHATFAVRLEDRATGQQVWAEEFPTNARPGKWVGSIADIGRMIAARIGAEHGIIARQLSGEHAARGFISGDAFSAIARCQHFMFSRQVGALIPAIEALQEITQRAPEIELAWTSLARLYLMNHSFELSGMYTPIEMVIGCANQCVLLEPASARTRCLLATALLVKGELASARRETELAMRHNGESLAHREMIGWLLALTGDWDQGVRLMSTALERNPFCQPCASHGIWTDAMRRGDFDLAYSTALEYRDRNFFWREMMLTSSLGHLGRLEEAGSSAAELLRCKPQFATRGRRLISHYIKSDDIRETIISGLRKAGVELA